MLRRLIYINNGSGICGVITRVQEKGQGKYKLLDLPISARALAGQIHAVVGVIVLLIHDFGEAEIGDLDLAADVTLGQEDVARLQVVMNHRRFDLV